MQHKYNSFVFILRILTTCILFITSGPGSKVFGQEYLGVKFLSPPLKIQVDGRVYELGYVQEREEKYLAALDSKRKVVEDRKVLDKIFFVEYVYRPVFDKPGDFIGPTDIGGYRKLDEFRLMLQLGDVTLFVREAAVRALVQAGKIYITGGSSAGTAVGEKIAEKTAEHLVQSILKNPATYLKARESLVFEDAASRWKRAETLFLKTKGSNVLRYEDAKKIHEDLSYGRAYGTGSMVFLGRLALKEGGGGDLLSQLGKIVEYGFDEFVSEVKGLYKQKNLVTATMLGYKLEKFLLDKVPIYKDYVENTKGFYKELNEFYRKYYLPERIERNLTFVKLSENKHLEVKPGKGDPIPEDVSERTRRFISEGADVFGASRAEIIKTLGKPIRHESREVRNTGYDVTNEFSDLFYDGLHLVIFKQGFPPYNEFITDMTVSSNKYKMKWDVNIGSPKSKVSELFKTPTTRSTSISSDSGIVVRHVYESEMGGKVEFEFRNNLVSKIKWSFELD